MLALELFFEEERVRAISARISRGSENEVEKNQRTEIGGQRTDVIDQCTEARIVEGGTEHDKIG